MDESSRASASATAAATAPGPAAGSGQEAGAQGAKTAAVPRSKGTTATQRLKQDYMRIMKDPIPYVTAVPLPHNLLEWHYVVRGPEGTVYEGGVYQGKLVFPAEFPFKPPAIYMLTPNGRFKTNVRLCLSISDYHPDTWNPAWSVSTILTGLLSFMMEEAATMGSIHTSDYEKKVLAKQSIDHNLNNKTFCDLFPDLVAELKEGKKRQAVAAEKSAGSTVAGRVTSLGKKIQSHGLRAAAAAQDKKDSSVFSSFMSTSLVLLLFVAFMYTVRYVLNTISSQSGSSSNGSLS